MNRSLRRHQSGVSLIETMVALTIGLFLLLTMYSVFETTRLTLGEQTGLSQLQDDERIALTVLTDSIQSAGYFPNPGVVTRSGALPAAAPFTAPGQALFGTHDTTAPGDTLTLRYVADTGTPSKTLDCLGVSGGTGIVVSVIGVSAAQHLQCAVNGAPAQDLVGGAGFANQGVQNIQFSYGVDPGATGSVTQFMTADAVTAANAWNEVLAVTVAVTFLNPLAGQPGEPATLTVTRTIALQNQL